MNIVVCVKYVPDATADRQFESDNTVDRVGVDGLLSELDEYAVEQSLQIKEKAGDDTTVTALCVGPEKALDAVLVELGQQAVDADAINGVVRLELPVGSGVGDVLHTDDNVHGGVAGTAPPVVSMSS